jgi:hypothetical protein
MTGPHDTVTTANISTTESEGTGAATNLATTKTNPQPPPENEETADGQKRREGRQSWTLRT